MIQLLYFLITIQLYNTTGTIPQGAKDNDNPMAITQSMQLQLQLNDTTTKTTHKRLNNDKYWSLLYIRGQASIDNNAEQQKPQPREQ